MIVVVIRIYDNVKMATTTYTHHKYRPAKVQYLMRLCDTFSTNIQPYIRTHRLITLLIRHSTYVGMQLGIYIMAQKLV